VDFQIQSSNTPVWPQMDQYRFRNVSNLDVVILNRIRDSTYIRLLFSNFLKLKISHTCTKCRHSTLAVGLMSITFIFVTDVKCGSHEIHKNNRANAVHGLIAVKKMFQRWTEVTLNRSGSRPGPGTTRSGKHPITISYLTLCTTTLELLDDSRDTWNGCQESGINRFLMYSGV